MTWDELSSITAGFDFNHVPCMATTLDAAPRRRHPGYAVHNPFMLECDRCESCKGILETIHARSAFGYYVSFLRFRSRATKNKLTSSHTLDEFRHQVGRPRLANTAAALLTVTPPECFFILA